jgi:arylsulfatase A-like enzyme
MAILLAAGLASASTARPNFIVYLADDHGVDFVGCYGNRAIRTPSIDALAAQGARFAAVFAASPTCAPSRAAMYSGLYPARNGLMGNHTQSRADLKTLPHALGALGYRVVLANKSHVKPESAYPFEVIQATLPRDPRHPRKYRAEGLDTAAIDRFLREHRRDKPDQPLCLFLADNGPHVTWEPNKIYDPAALPVPPIMVDTPKTRAALANYYQDITSVDQRVGRVLASVREHGYEMDTLFIYTADQGPEWPHCKWTVYDTGLRVPFIARWPGRIEPGSTRAALVSLIDLMPTFIDLAGGSVPADLDGRSFKDVLLGRTERHRDRVFASHSRDGQMNVFPQRCVRDDRYKYVLNLHPDRKWTTHFTLVEGIPGSHKDVYDSWLARATEDPAAARLVQLIERHPGQELYDTHADPYELDNLADRPEHRERVERFRAELEAWRKQQNDPIEP